MRSPDKLLRYSINLLSTLQIDRKKGVPQIGVVRFDKAMTTFYFFKKIWAEKGDTVGVTNVDNSYEGKKTTGFANN